MAPKRAINYGVRVPFSSTAPRTFQLATEQNTVTPGPGSYSVPSTLKVAPKRISGRSHHQVTPRRQSRSAGSSRTRSTTGSGSSSWSDFSTVARGASVEAGGAFGSSAGRFKDLYQSQAETVNTPGPGAYAAPSEWDKLGKRNGGKKKKPQHGRRVQWVRTKTAPSIPAPAQCFGYEEDDDGTLLPQAPPPRDKDVGPGYYDVPVDTISTTKAAAGSAWAKRKDVASNPIANPSVPPTFAGTKKGGKGNGSHAPPPPTAYNVMGDFDRIAQQSKEPLRTGKMFVSSALPASRPSAAFLSRTKRGMNTSHSDGDPGPGSYTPGPTPGTLGAVPGPKTKPVAHFGSTAPRTWQAPNGASDTPGPGSYSMLDEAPPAWGAPSAVAASSATKKSFRVANRAAAGGFDSTAPRFADRRDNGSDTPGPGSYNSDVTMSLAAQVAAHKAINVSVKGGAEFAGTGRQDGPLGKAPAVGLSVDASDNPGPGAYNVGGNIGDDLRRRRGPSSSFASRASRDSDWVRKAAKEQGPGPTSYGVSEAWSAMKDAKVVRASTGVFVSSQPRFRDAKRMDDVPGPGQYSIPDPAQAKAGGRWSTKEARFKAGTVLGTPTDGPGPGSYESGGPDSWVKRSYNVNAR